MTSPVLEVSAREGKRGLRELLLLIKQHYGQPGAGCPVAEPPRVCVWLEPVSQTSSRAVGRKLKHLCQFSLGWLWVSFLFPSQSVIESRPGFWNPNILWDSHGSFKNLIFSRWSFFSVLFCGWKNHFCYCSLIYAAAEAFFVSLTQCWTAARYGKKSQISQNTHTHTHAVVDLIVFTSVILASGNWKHVSPGPWHPSPKRHTGTFSAPNKAEITQREPTARCTFLLARHEKKMLTAESTSSAGAFFQADLSYSELKVWILFHWWLKYEVILSEFQLDANNEMESFWYPASKCSHWKAVLCFF